MGNPILDKAFEKHVRDFLCSESYCFIKEVSLRMRREHLTHRSLNINKHVSIHPSTCRCKIVSRTNIEVFHPRGTSDTNQKVVEQMNSIWRGEPRTGCPHDTAPLQIRAHSRIHIRFPSHNCTNNLFRVNLFVGSEEGNRSSGGRSLHDICSKTSRQFAFLDRSPPFRSLTYKNVCCQNMAAESLCAELFTEPECV